MHPDRRRRGVGTALLAALEDRTGPLRVWAHGAHPGAAALADRFGLVRDRELWRMRRSLREPFATPNSRAFFLLVRYLKKSRASWVFFPFVGIIHGSTPTCTENVGVPRCSSRTPSPRVKLLNTLCDGSALPVKLQKPVLNV